MRGSRRPLTEPKLPIPQDPGTDLSAADFPQRPILARGGKAGIRPGTRSARAVRDLAISEPSERGQSIRSVPERDAPAEVRAQARLETQRLSKLPRGSEEAQEINRYVRRLWSVPWLEHADHQPRLRSVRNHLDATVLGMEKAKEFLLENLAVNRRNPERAMPVLCLAGPPGNGKNSLAEALAEALGRPHKRFNLSGMAVREELLGIDRAEFRGARAGKILSKVCDAGCLDPVLVINGVDVLANPERADLLEGLLAVADPKRRAHFYDRYLGLEVDLSRMILILTANNAEAIPEALQRYAEVIEVPGQSEDDKVAIAHQLILPRLRAEHGLKESDLSLSREVLLHVIRDYTLEGGVNALTQVLGVVCRKRSSDLVRRMAPAREAELSVEDLRAMLGAGTYVRSRREEEPMVGLALGLAWTQARGELLEIEAEAFPGSGGMRFTGQIGEVMKESAAIAHSVVRARCATFNVSDADFCQMDFHLHFPMGGVPKDGPSAGAGIAVALASAMSDRPVRNDIAITGEVSLRGKILLVGGLREKALAAYREGASAMIFPQANIKDVESIPADVREQLQLVPVETIDEVFAVMISPILRVKSTGGGYVIEVEGGEAQEES